MSAVELNAMLSRFQETVHHALRRLRHLIDTEPDRFPLFTRDGEWCFAEQADPLAMGCTTGMLWDLYDLTGDDYWRGRAEHYCRLMDSLPDHEAAPGGGLAYFYGGHMKGYEASVQAGAPDAVLRERLVQVARAQAGSFMAAGGYLASPAQPSLLGIERILDVPIILFAASETQEHQLFDVAARHCATTRKYLVRGDGSVAAAVRMDPATGHCLGPVAGAAARSDSTWACGQAWAILGFATAGRLLSFEPWLQTARQSTQFLVERLSGNPVPLWDLDLPAGAVEMQDSAAAAVAAAALLELADAEQTIGRDQAQVRRHLQDLSLRLLDALCQPQYLGAADSPATGLFKHAVGNLPAGWAVDESVIWGDAFGLRALSRAIRLLRHRGS